jgi:hypothetical protein
MAIRDQVASKGSGTFENQSNAGGTLSKAATVALGVLKKGSASQAAAAARNGRVFNDQLVGKK